MYFLISLLVSIAVSKKHRTNKAQAVKADDTLDLLVPNSCLTHEDDSNVLVKLMADDDVPILDVTCSNQYMIVNLKQDRGWEQYLSSGREYHYNVIGPEKDDHGNWQEWIVPPMTEFLVSPDCATCDEDHELNQLYGTSSGYYMTPVTAGCTQLPIGRIGCDMDWRSNACRVCETQVTREPGYWLSYEVYNGLNDPETTLHFENEVDQENFAKYGLCGFTIRDAKAEHESSTDTFEHCKTVTHEDVEGETILPRRKPSVGQDGRFCVCVKPDTYTQYTVRSDDLEKKQDEIEEAIQPEYFDGLSDQEKLNVVQLYQSDFTDGTYRITEPGKYVIMEDIVFDFKAPEGYLDGNLDTYNGPDDWWPSSDQIDDYPGAGDLKNSYFLGFWAGITIESSDVILELNHHTLEMSEAFYYQQSFFALISLTSQVFLPGQGPGFFGAHPQSATNVMIRNGKLGLSSHFGIQGNFNKDVLVENIQIHDFKTHGIQFNGFDGVTIKNVDVGPNRKVDRLSPYYAHMKALVPIYRKMIEDEEIAADTCVEFMSPRYAEGECVTMQSLVDDVVTLLDMAFEYVVLDKTDYDEIDVGKFTDNLAMQRKINIWQEGRSVVINGHHSTQTATLYGIFLNYIGSNVIGWYAGSETTKSQNVFIENVKVHDLHHDTFENIAFSQGDETAAQRILNCLNAPFNAYHVFGVDTVHKISQCNNYIEDNGGSTDCQAFRSEPLQYIGNIVNDVQILSYELINNYGLSWNYCSAGAADMGALVDFAIRGTQFADLTPLLVGSHDPMIHPGKGVMGLRLNGVDYVDIKDLKIDNIHSSTALGSLLGGEYDNVVSQQAPYMNGFSMNMVNGLTATFSTNIVVSNVEVSHIISNTGLAYGVAVWYKTHMQILGKKGLKIHHVHAGVELPPSSDYRKDSFPNLRPEGCAFRIYDDVIYNAVIKYNENEGNSPNLVIDCISGHTGCLMENDDYTNLGYVRECEDLEEAADDDEEEFVEGAVTVIKLNKNNHHNNYHVVVAALAVAASIVLILVIYSKLSRKSLIQALEAHSEATPLLTQQ
eukprot:202607_1